MTRLIAALAIALVVALAPAAEAASGGGNGTGTSPGSQAPPAGGPKVGGPKKNGKENGAGKKQGRKHGAKKKHRKHKRHKARKRPARKPAERKTDPAHHLWYRVSVKGQGTFHAESPNNSTGARTMDVTTGFQLASRAAVIIHRDVSLAHPKENRVLGDQFTTSAGLSGTATAFSRTATIEATQYCTRDSAADTMLAPAMLDGGVSILVGPDYKEVTFGADYGLDHGLVAHEESGRECRDSNGNLYYKRDPKSSRGPGAWGGLLCDKRQGDDPDTVRTVTGDVHWGAAFEFQVHCHHAMTNGPAVEVSSLDYTVKFAPCPGRARNVGGC
ncbi:MAG TPA: hypothetical protein VGF25_11540 [Thermoleophilaceae bacterium]|jgi:hypothetical protein